VKLYKISNKNRFGTTLFFIHTNISAMQPVEMYAIKERSNDNEKKSLVGYFTFGNKNCLHYKVKVIFVFTSLINIYWLNVSIFFSFHLKIKRLKVAESGKPALFIRWGVVSYINRDSLTWTIVGSVFGCVIRSAG
jgi:hypothetical protein